MRRKCVNVVFELEQAVRGCVACLKPQWLAECLRSVGC